MRPWCKNLCDLQLQPDQVNIEMLQVARWCFSPLNPSNAFVVADALGWVGERFAHWQSRQGGAGAVGLLRGRLRADGTSNSWTCNWKPSTLDLYWRREFSNGLLHQGILSFCIQTLILFSFPAGSCIPTADSSTCGEAYHILTKLDDVQRSRTPTHSQGSQGCSSWSMTGTIGRV